MGNMARCSVINVKRVINALPYAEDFNILFKAALVNVADKVKQLYTITPGLPL